MNFALMFALALGIDYALFVVHRFRGALFGSHLSPIEAVAVTMDTAGKAVLFSGVTVLISLSAVMLVPSPAFRSMSLGIMLAVIFVLAATLTLLPAVLAKLGPKVDKLALPWAHSGEHRSATVRRVGRAALATPGRLRRDRARDPRRPCDPRHPTEDRRCRRSRSSRPPTPPASATSRSQAAFGPGATGPLQIVTPAADAAQVARIARHDPGIAALMPTQASDGYALVTAIPKQDPSNPAVGATIDRLRAQLPAGSLIGGAVAENHDLQAALTAKTPLVIGVVLGLGFLLLLDRAAGAADRRRRRAHQPACRRAPRSASPSGSSRTVRCTRCSGFQPQGFLDAWGPVFFFAMIFAISMDYTVFLLSSAKEHWDRTHDPQEAMIGGVAHSGRVIFAAGAVMVAVFFTFALSGPLPPKEMGIILGVAVLLDAALIRLLLLPVLLRVMGSGRGTCPVGRTACCPTSPSDTHEKGLTP